MSCLTPVGGLREAFFKLSQYTSSLAFSWPGCLKGRDISLLISVSHWCTLLVTCAQSIFGEWLSRLKWWSWSYLYTTLICCFNPRTKWIGLSLPIRVKYTEPGFISPRLEAINNVPLLSQAPEREEKFLKASCCWQLSWAISGLSGSPWGPQDYCAQSGYNALGSKSEENNLYSLYIVYANLTKAFHTSRGVPDWVDYQHREAGGGWWTGKSINWTPTSLKNILKYVPLSPRFFFLFWSSKH